MSKIHPSQPELIPLTPEELDNILGDSNPGPQDEFTPTTSNSKSNSQQQKLFNEKIKEQQQRYWFRWIISGFFMILLIAQHFLLFIFVKAMIKHDQIQNIQPLLGIIIPATLGETYAIMKIIVKYVFAPGDFNSIEK